MHARFSSTPSAQKNSLPSSRTLSMAMALILPLLFSQNLCSIVLCIVHNNEGKRVTFWRVMYVQKMTVYLMALTEDEGDSKWGTVRHYLVSPTLMLNNA